jgi:hypothetical protein
LENRVWYNRRKILEIITGYHQKEIVMANCSEMKAGDIFVCEICGLELKVHKTCRCGGADGTENCTVPLQCCNQEMVKKIKATVL